MNSLKQTQTYDDTFLEIVADTAKRHQRTTFASWYNQEGNLTDERTFGEVWENAGKIAHYLRREWKVKKGQRVVLCYDFGLHFFEALFGCLRAGVTAVLVYPPGPPLKNSLAELTKVVADCKPVLILTDTRISMGRILDKSNPFSKSRHLWPNEVEFKVTDKLFKKSVSPFDDLTSQPSDTAFLQYTSGSTGNPKVVMVTFGALRCNFGVCRGLINARSHRAGERDVVFSWLPQYHDLGLLVFGIFPFATGGRLHMMSPLSFIRKPLLWLELMSRHQVQWTAAPDFAYQLVVRKFEEAQELANKNGKPALPDLDLSHLKNVLCAAEPCRPETHNKFSDTFSPYGLPANWYVSSYGLAENVVSVSNCSGMHLSTPRKEDRGKVYVACGELASLHPSILFKLVDPKTGLEVKDGQTGELWLAGGSVTAGYFEQPALTEQYYKAQLSSMPGVDFFRTDDLFFTQSGYLYICGRLKDQITLNGENFYPQDIEYTVQETSAAVRPDCVAVFSSIDSLQDDLVDVVFEIRKHCVGDAEAVASKIRAAVLRQHGIRLGRVVAIPERSIPKTTSGKIQRRATREALANRTLYVIYESHQQEPMTDLLPPQWTAALRKGPQGDITECSSASESEGHQSSSMIVPSPYEMCHEIFA